MEPLGDANEQADGTATAVLSNGQDLGPFNNMNDAISAIVRAVGDVTFYQDSAGPYQLGPFNSP
jgi:hypothetical protein